jgi:hypothetical protein
MVGTDVGAITARGGGAVGRSIGVAIGLGETAFTAFGIFSGVGVCFAFAPLVLAIPFFFGVASFFATDFFLVDLDFAVELDGFFDLGEADGSGVSLDFASSASDSFFFDDFAFGVALGSVVSLVFAFFDAGEGVALLFGFFVFGDAVGDASASRVLRNCSRLRASSSFPWAQRYVPIIALSANAIVSQIRKRATAAERNRPGVVFKRPAAREELELWSRVPVRGAGSRLTYRQEARANRSDTSR